MKGPAMVAGLALVLVVTGVGFACGDGHSCAGPAACPPSIDVVWTGPLTTAPSPSSVQCSVVIEGPILYVTVGHLIPGASCAVGAKLVNEGSSAVTLTAQLLTYEPPGCLAYSYADDLVGAHTPPTLNPSASFAYLSTTSLGASAPKTCMGSVAEFSIVIFAQAVACSTSSSGGGCH